MSEDAVEYVPTPRELAAANRTRVPGTLLSAVGLLNVPMAIALVFYGIEVYRMPDDEFNQIRQESIEKTRTSMPALAQMMERQGGQADEKTSYTVIYLLWGAVAFIAAMVTFYAGYYMRRLERYGMAIAGPVLAMIPLISCLGCCGIGEAVGIWAMIVLVSPEVRAEFI